MCIYQPWSDSRSSPVKQGHKQTCCCYPLHKQMLTKELRSENLMVLLAILLFLLITSHICHYHSSVWVSSDLGANLFSPVFSMRTFLILKNVFIALKYLKSTISQNKLCLWHSKQLSVYHFLFRHLQFFSEISSALFKQQLYVS